jgi:Phospholipase D-like domain at C-terminus of MIT
MIVYCTHNTISPVMTNSLNLSPLNTALNPPLPPMTALSPHQHLMLQLKQLRLVHMLTHWESLEHQAMQEHRIDNGWIIKIGRGLNFYQRPNSRFEVGANDLSLRKCLETKVDIFRRLSSHKGY